MPSKTAPLTFPKKGEAHPPADAIGRQAEQPAAEPVASTPAPIEPPAAAAAPTAAALASRPDLAGLLEGDDLVQINVSVPRRIRNQLHLLKLTGQAESIKAVTADALTKAVEQLMAAGQVERSK